MKKTTDYELDGLKISLPLRCENYRHKYPGQFYHQQAYIELDPESKTLTCDWNGEIGNAVPFSVYHGRVLRFSFNPFMHLKDVRKTMRTIAPICAEMIKSYDEKWDGNNFRGVWDQTLHDKVYNIIAGMEEEA